MLSRVLVSLLQANKMTSVRVKSLLFCPASFFRNLFWDFRSIFFTIGKFLPLNVIPPSFYVHVWCQSKSQFTIKQHCCTIFWWTISKVIILVCKYLLTSWLHFHIFLPCAPDSRILFWPRWHFFFEVQDHGFCNWHAHALVNYVNFLVPRSSHSFPTRSRFSSVTLSNFGNPVCYYLFMFVYLM